MWQPTHIQVTVQKARGLILKGKNDTNDCFVVISLGKDKFQTSIKEKASSTVEWREECELSIPTQGNTASVGLTVHHRNALGIDEFLGQIHIPLTEFDVYERPRSKWYRLKGKPEKDKKKGEKERGEIEAKVSFTVKSGSLSDVSKKDLKKGGSITSLKHLGGSLMSLGSKEKQSIKSFAKSVSHKIDKIAKPGRKKSGRKSSRDSGQGFPEELQRSRQSAWDADPGVISDSDEDFGFDEEVTANTRSSINSGSPYSTVSRGSSLMQDHGIIEEHVAVKNSPVFPNEHKPPPKPLRIGELIGSPQSPGKVLMVGSMENVGRSDSRSSLNTSRSSSTLDITKDDASRFPEIKPLKLGKKSHEDGDEKDGKKRKGKGDGLKNKLFGSRSNLAEEDSRFVEGGNDRLPNPPQRHSRLPQEIHDKFAGKSREDLMELIVTLQSTVDKQANHARDMEDYIDDLLLRVMEQTPQILQAPVTTPKKMKVFGHH